MTSTQLFPEIIDGSTIGARPTTGVFLPIGIEGQMDNGGTKAVGNLDLISRPSDADTFYGAASSLSTLVKYVLDRGAGPVYAIPSAKGSAPTLVQRQAAWQTLEANRNVRIRLTDSVTQADLVALATSCDNAALLNNKQFAIVGMAAATTKANLLTAATALTSKRCVLAAPGVYDENGVLRSGAFLAASYAAAVSVNNDPTDDLDMYTLTKLTGMEKDSIGNDLFRQIVVSGVQQNDFEDLLQGGVSPAMPGLDGGLAISHLRMTYKTDSTFDALMTRIIMDQQFVLVRDYALRFNALRKGNTPATRGQLASGIEDLLKSINTWILPVAQADGTLGYGVRVDPSSNFRQQIISYQGEIVRGTQTILVAPNFTIPV